MTTSLSAPVTVSDSSPTSLVLSTSVSYKDVDREEYLLLSSLFKFLQEAAVRHANQYDIGTRAMLTRQESWVLNRMAVAVHRYPRHEELLRIETWSTGVHGFRGYRDFRLYVGDELVVSASSLWIYLNLKTRSLVRVSPELAENFPTGTQTPFDSALDRFAPLAPSGDATSFPITLRYSDIDVNGHVSNTAYFDFLQTGLILAGLPIRPERVGIRFLREIRPDLASINVRLEPRRDATLFSFINDRAEFAVGQLV